MQKTKKIVSLFMHAKSFVDNLIITPFQNATSRLGFYIISKFYIQLVLSISKEFNVCKIPGYTDFWIFMSSNVFFLHLVKKMIRTFLWYFQSCFMYFVVSRREFILVFDWRKRSSFHLWFSLMLRWMHLLSLHVILLTYCYFHRVFLSFKCMFKRTM